MLPAVFIEKLSHNAFLVHVAHLHEPTDTKVIYTRHRVPVEVGLLRRCGAGGRRAPWSAQGLPPGGGRPLLGRFDGGGLCRQAQSRRGEHASEVLAF